MSGSSRVRWKMNSASPHSESWLVTWREGGGEGGRREGERGREGWREGGGREGGREGGGEGVNSSKRDKRSVDMNWNFWST